MSDDVNIPALPNSNKSGDSTEAPFEREGELDHTLDVDLGDGTFGETRRAIAGLTGDWKPGKVHLDVDWDDPNTYDEDWGGGWDYAIIYDD